MPFAPAEILTLTACAHCGDACPDAPSKLATQPELDFCCAGCRAVYELLNASNLCTYYRLDAQPGQKVKPVDLPGRFDYLDSEAVQAQLLAFRSPTLAWLTFRIPQMHCASCIWLLENLFKLNPGISASRVNFLRKELTVSYQPASASLKEVVTLLAAINYEPQITLAELGAQPHHGNRTLYYQLGVAGAAAYMACFGLGTLPLMLGLSLSGRLVLLAWRARMRQAVPYTATLLAALFIVRGLGLGIPYLSPQLKAAVVPAIRPPLTVHYCH